MDEKELNVLCEYIYMPRLEKYLEIATGAGYTAFLTVGGDGLPALEIDTDDGQFAVSLMAVETDIEEPEEIEDGDYELLVRMYLRTNGYENDRKAGFMIFPAEALETDADFAKCLDLLVSGLWMEDAAERIKCVDSAAEPGLSLMAAPRLAAFSDILAEADFLHTEIIYREGEWPKIIAESDGKVISFSFLLFSEDDWILRMEAESGEEGTRNTGNEKSARSAIFPDFGEMKESEIYMKELALFERFFV